MSVIVLGDGIFSAPSFAVPAWVMHLKMYSLKIKGRKFLPCLHCTNANFSFYSLKFALKILDQEEGAMNHDHLKHADDKLKLFKNVSQVAQIKCIHRSFPPPRRIKTI